jgi:hypothetical protein
MGHSPLSTYLHSSLSLSLLPVCFVLPLDQKLSMSKPIGKNTTCVHSVFGCKNRVKQRLVPWSEPLHLHALIVFRAGFELQLAPLYRDMHAGK